jgi:hypothetical protein
MKSRAGILLVILVSLDQPGVAWAGMPMVTLTDLARMRIQTISFFLLGFLASSWVLQRIWNSLRADFPRLPRLGYRKALGVITLWGLLFVLILTMISGARELMTPGAWKKAGYTYKLAEDRPAATEGPHENERRQTLERLRIALWTYARGHEGRFPPAEDRQAIPEEAWRVPDPSGMRYLYVAGRSADVGHAILAYEPGLFETAERLVLRTDGRIVLLSPEAIDHALAGERTP